MVQRFVRISFVIFFIINGVFMSCINAQVVSPSFRHYTTEDGLPSSEVYFILQDKKGNVWFGTDRGIARFDGYEFRAFSYKDGLTDNTVFKLSEDKKGRIWMLTFSGKVFYFEGDKIYPFKYNDILLETGHAQVPYGLYVDSLENVYVSFTDHGEIKINSKGELEETYTKQNSPGINYVMNELSPEKVFVSIVSTIDRDVKVLHSVNGKTSAFPINSFPEERFNAIRLNNDIVVFTKGKSLYLKTKDAVKLQVDLPEKVLSLSKDNHQNVWAGTENGVFLFDQLELKPHFYHYLERNTITCIMQDLEGGYWFSTLNNGIYYMSGYGIEGIPFNQGLFQKPTSLTNDFLSTVYAGCWNGVLVQIKNGETKVVYSPGEQANHPVTNLSSFPGDDKIYLSRSDPGYFSGNKFFQYKGMRSLGIKTDFLKSSNGKMYSGGTRFIFVNKGDSILQYALLDQRISCLIETHEHKLLFGSNLGVYVYDEKTKKSVSYRKELDNIRVDDIKLAGNNLLFATKGKGVLVVVNDSIIKIDESDGLCSNLVNKLLVSGNEVWCTTNKGISHIVFNSADGFKYSITNIRSNDGLFSDEINDITMLNDTIYVAMNSGVSFFNTNTDFVNHKTPPVYITALRVNNSDTSINAKMKFAHDYNNLQIGFNGISYRSNQRIKYRYQLTTGTDTISSYTNNREVEFLSLSPGLYNFQVSAMNNSGVWSESPASFSFTINPAWWQTWWFRSLVAILFVAVIYVFYKRQVKKLQHDFEMERRQASLQLTAMRAQMNPHFIFNVMNSIRNYMLNHDTKSAQKYLTSFSKLVRYVLDNSQVQEITLEEELSALRNYTELEMQRFEKGFDFKIICEEGINLSETNLLSMLLQPFVENAIKHGISRMECGGKILVDIRKTKKSLLIAIEDNGVGMEEASKWNESNRGDHISHGTSINLERIEAYNKVYNKNIKTRVISLTDNEGKCAGTRVEVEI